MFLKDTYGSAFTIFIQDLHVSGIDMLDDLGPPRACCGKLHAKWAPGSTSTNVSHTGARFLTITPTILVLVAMVFYVRGFREFREALLKTAAFCTRPRFIAIFFITYSIVAAIAKSHVGVLYPVCERVVMRARATAATTGVAVTIVFDIKHNTNNDAKHHQNDSYRNHDLS